MDLLNNPVQHPLRKLGVLFFVSTKNKKPRLSPGLSFSREIRPPRRRAAARLAPEAWRGGWWGVARWHQRLTVGSLFSSRFGCSGRLIVGIRTGVEHWPGRPADGF